MIFLGVLFLFTGIANLFGRFELRLERLKKRELIIHYAILIIFVSILILLIPISSLILGTSTPFLVVTSGSMRPTLNIGDLLILSKPTELKEGDIIAFKHERIIIVHRIYEISEKGIKTKGDALPNPDFWIVNPSDVLGKVIFSIPLIGYIPMFLISYPALLVLLALLISFSPILRAFSFVNKIEQKPASDFEKKNPIVINPETTYLVLQPKNLEFMIEGETYEERISMIINLLDKMLSKPEVDKSVTESAINKLKEIIKKLEEKTSDLQ